ncbi:hypothetical protein JCM10213v2_005057 [Rhodosporidiobolus nylandii]
MAVGSAGQEEQELAGDEVVELTRFAEKKAWIDERITFLSALPPVEVTSPEPPERSKATKGELEEWWAEHDRIEQEVEGFDYGDLKRMRELARDKSAQPLSPRDTDLIELTLTTLFSVDKLLHLLRDRRKALGLLGYRLQWEDATAAAWGAHEQLADDLLPAFLEKARWTLPAAMSSPSRHASDDPTPEIPPSASTSSLSASTTSRRLSVLDSASTSGSAMSRTLKSQMLSLSLSQLTSYLRTLSSTAVPASATLLDKLIDTSPAPLPDSFLDEQDRLELEIAKTTKGCRSFAEGMVRQWKEAEQVFWAAHEAERAAEALAREAEDAIPLLRALPTSSSPFTARVADLASSLASTRIKLTALPSPEHPSRPEQPAETARLRRTLEKNLARAASAVERAEEAARQWDGARRAVERARAVQRRMEGACGVLQRAREALETLSANEGKPKGPDDGISCLERGDGETVWEERWDGASTPALHLLDGEGQALLRSAADALASLSSAGVDPVLRKELREEAHRLRSELDAVKTTVEGEKLRRERVGAARAVAEAATGASEKVNAARARLGEAAREAAWREAASPSPADGLDPAELVASTRAAVEEALASPFEHAAAILSPPPCASLLAHVTSLASSVRADAGALQAIAATVEGARAQASAVRQFEGEAVERQMALEGVVKEAEEMLDWEKEAWGQGELRKAREGLAKRVQERGRIEELVEGLHLKVPFLASSPSAPSTGAPPSLLAGIKESDLDLDLPALDASVRAFLNSTSLRLRGAADEAQRQVMLLEHLEEAFAWDNRAGEAEDAVDRVERKAERLSSDVEAREGDSKAVLAPLLDRLDAVDLSSPRSAVKHQSDSLTALLTSPSSSLAPFHAHPSRHSRLDGLSSRLSAAVASVESAKEALLAARKAREERLAAWERRRDELQEAVLEQTARYDSLTEEVQRVREGVESERTRATSERDELLASDALTESSELDLPALAAAASTLPSLSQRIDAAHDAFSLLNTDFATLETSLPSIQRDSPSASLNPASLAHDAVLAASSSATSALSLLSRSIEIAYADATAFSVARDAELHRRREEREALRLAQLEAWQSAVRELLEKVDTDRKEVERVAGEARRALGEVERRAEAKREAPLAPLSDVAEAAPASDATERRAEVERLNSQLSDLRQRTREFEGRSTALQTDDLVSGPAAGPLAEDLDAQVSSLPLAIDSTASVLELLEGAVDDLEREEAQRRAARDVQLERRRLEEEKHDELLRSTAPSAGLIRSQALPRLSVDGTEVDDFFSAHSPSSPDAVFSLTLTPEVNESSDVRELRARLRAINTQQWLDSTAVLQLPRTDDANEVLREVAACRVRLDELDQDEGDALLWADVDGLRSDIAKKEKQAKRMMALADFGEKVDVADGALSNLLDAVDAADPSFPPSSPLPDSAPALPLPDAISAASATVTSLRLAAIPLVDDARVERAIQRVEETWSEMLSMVEPPRAGSAASSASTTSRRSLRQRVSDISSRASSRSSSRASTHTSFQHVPSRPSSQSSSFRSSTRPTSRPPSSAASSGSRSSRPPSSRTASVRSSVSAVFAPETPRRPTKEDDAATPTARHQGKSGLPLPSFPSLRSVSPLPKATPTVVRPFSFNTPSKRDIAGSTSSIPRRTASTLTRRDSISSVASALFSPPMMQRGLSASSTSSRRESLASSISSAGRHGDRRSSYESRYSIASLGRSTSRSTPPKRTQPYRPNMKSKLDRQVGDIVNSLAIHIPIEVAQEGRRTDESGQYWIGGRLYFCRILRSKMVMVRIGGGWQNLMSFLVTHFGVADGLTISPSSSLKSKLAGAEPEWISSQTVRQQLAASQSSASLRDYLSSSVSSRFSGEGGVANSDLSLSTTSLSMHGLGAMGSFSPPSNATPSRI